ncbi:MAG: beta-galactosidase [Spirochaetales bacterium]|nr:beta-galactosidase [Spirochaetales bacterium]
MKEYILSLDKDYKKITSGELSLSGKNPGGDEISFTNYFITLKGRPFMVICGEFHFSRYDHHLWEKEIVKMKMNGVNVVSTYIFWIHHEEVRGEWEWTGSKNLRAFIELCGRHGLFVIIRIGPFNHGEVRNGGFPDWLYGMPCEIRGNDEEYLKIVSDLYGEIGRQVQGLLYKDGGPVIGTQLENEHNHSAALWAHTAGVNEKWCPTGSDGEEHLLRLKQIALASGIDTPLFTCTGWGGASTPAGEMLPLWGGYAYWPWIYYEKDRDPGEEHPATPEYIFRDKHNNSIPESYNFKPKYRPEDYPYACCEMGGGMTQFYKHRFVFDYNSVPAMTLVKAAEGCNFLGYYMFHGGSNPPGKTIPHTNDKATPCISYDFDAMVGEFGQIRESYRRTKLQHYFFTTFGEQFCKTGTILPENASAISPDDCQTLRYACRSAEGAGFLFINNFQDHREMPAKKDVLIVLQREGEALKIPSRGTLSIPKDSFCLYPFHFSFGRAHLNYATAQLITKMEAQGKEYYFFCTPFTDSAEYSFRAEGISRISGSRIVSTEGDEIIVTAGRENPLFEFEDEGGNCFAVYTLSDEESLNFWKARVQGRERVFLSGTTVMPFEDHLKLESENNPSFSLKVFPDFQRIPEYCGTPVTVGKGDTLFSEYVFAAEKKEITPAVRRLSPDRAVLTFTQEMFTGVEEVLLKIRYRGDMGQAYIDGKLIHDNFGNGTEWVIGLTGHRNDILEKGLLIYISPLQTGFRINSQSVMAGWSREADESLGEILSIEAIPVYSSELHNV